MTSITWRQNVSIKAADVRSAVADHQKPASRPAAPANRRPVWTASSLCNWTKSFSIICSARAARTANARYDCATCRMEEEIDATKPPREMNAWMSRVNRFSALWNTCDRSVDKKMDLWDREKIGCRPKTGLRQSCQHAEKIVGHWATFLDD